MLISPNVLGQVTLPDTWDSLDGHDCECPISGCPNHYSPGCGYFTLEPNLAHRDATGSAALRINRSATQVICYRHKYSMFLESFDPCTNLGNFRCPHKDCQQRMAVDAGGPPAYWLGEGYFKQLN